MQTPQVLRLGIIGCGGNGRGHLGGFLLMDGVQVVGLADPSKAAREKAWEMTGKSPDVKLSADYKTLLAKTKPDAVLISTPHSYHHDQILDSLAAGCHVLCEKPLVCSVKEAKDVIAAAKRAQKILAISYQRHVAPQFMYLREALRAGKIGDVVFLSALQSQNWLESQRGTWRQKLALSGGGQVNDSGSHLLDIALWITGLEPASVVAFQDNRGTEVDILTAMSVSCRGGAIMNFSIVAQSVHFVEEITIWGTQGTLQLRLGGGDDGLYHWEKEGAPRKIPQRELPKRKYAHTQNNFLAAIRGQDEVAAPPECGLAVIRLTEAVWKSARSGKAEKVK